MDELEDIKKRKLEELQAMQQEQLKEEEQIQQQIQQLEFIVKRILTKKALERYGNLKAAHPEKAVQLLAVIGQAIQAGKIGQIDDEQLKELLRRLSPEKSEFKIRRV